MWIYLWFQRLDRYTCPIWNSIYANHIKLSPFLTCSVFSIADWMKIEFKYTLLLTLTVNPGSTSMSVAVSQTLSFVFSFVSAWVAFVLLELLLSCMIGVVLTRVLRFYSYWEEIRFPVVQAGCVWNIVRAGP